MKKILNLISIFMNGAILLQIMVPDTYVEFIEELTYLVKKKAISMSRIDDAVDRILRVKFIMGLFEYPMSDRTMLKHLGSQVVT